MRTYLANKQAGGRTGRGLLVWPLMAMAVLGATGAWAQTARPPIVAMDFEVTDHDGNMSVAESENMAARAKIKGLGNSAEVVEVENGHALKLSQVKAIQEAKTYDHGCVVIEDFPTAFPEGLTFQARINRAGIEENEYDEVLFANWAGDPGAGLALQIGTAGNLRFFSRIETPGGVESEGIAHHGPVLTPGEWVTITLTFHDGEALLYVDGVERAYSEGPVRTGEGGTLLTIGAYNGGYAYGFEGLIDDVRIYDYARTPEQIAQDAKALDSGG